MYFPGPIYTGLFLCAGKQKNFNFSFSGTTHNPQVLWADEQRMVHEMQVVLTQALFQQTI